METLLRVLFLGLVVMAIGAIADARAQTPAPAQTPTPVPIVGNIYSVTYIEVMPTSKADAATLLRRYREAAQKEGGNLRCEVVQRIDQPHQFAILEIWKDQTAFEAHGKSANTVDTREKIAAIRNAPTDERVHTALSIGPIDAPSSVRGGIYVATHVDVIPPRKAICGSRSSSRSTGRITSPWSRSGKTRRQSRRTRWRLPRASFATSSRR